jgi:hypothetical protein
MNIRARPRELDRVRRDLAEAFRLEREAISDAPPEGFHALLKHLETRVCEVEGKKAFAHVEARIADLMLAVGSELSERGLS